MNIIVVVIEDFYIESFIANCLFFIELFFCRFLLSLRDLLGPFGPFGVGVSPGMLNDGGGI